MWSTLVIFCSLLFTQSAVFDFSAMKPGEGPWGAKVQLLGKNFDAKSVKVYYDNTEIKPLSVAPTVITVAVPENAKDAWFEIEQGGRRLRAPAIFTIKNVTFIEKSDPATGPADIWVRLHGRFFTPDTDFYLGKLRLNAKFISEKEVSVFLPPGTPSDFFYCTSFGARLKSAVKYSVLPFPTVSSVSPEKAWHEDKITVRGRNFCADAGLLVGDKPLTVTRRTADTIEATIPDGVVTGPIRVRCYARDFAAPRPLAIEPPYGAITKAVPEAGAVGDWVELTGSGFTAKDQFWLGNAAITEVKWISEAQVRVRIPAKAVSDLFHYKSHNRIRPSTVHFTIAIPPELAGTTPVKAWNGEKITLRGKGFCPDIRVEVGGVAFPVDTVTSTQEITMLVPRTAKSGKFLLMCKHWKIEAGAFDLTPPALAIKTASPLSGPPGTEIVFEGAFFPPDAKVFIDKMSLATRVEGAGRMIATVPVATKGKIRVFAYERFWETPHLYETAYPKPEPSKFEPAVSWHLGSVTIRGKNLCTKPSVFLGKTPVKVLEATAAYVVVALPAKAEAGEFTIECFMNRAKVPGKLQLKPPVGNIASIFPLSGPVGTFLTVRGSQLKKDSAFFIGKVQLPARYVSDTEIQIEIPPAAPSGKIVLVAARLRVETDFTFTLAYPLPKITAVMPDLGWHGDKVTLEGSQFCAQAEVVFPGDKPAKVLARTSHTKLIVAVPEGALPGFVVVKCPGVEGKAANYFTVAPPYARITAVSAESGCGGDELTFTGVNFDDKVRFYMGETLLAVKIVSKTQATAIIPANARSGDFQIESFGKKLPTRFSYIIKSRLCRGK
ncbi:IPT/TIG domain-containing protein [Myxococcota bacterium]|nr:IPT/TIG domain-containing protein [Myxococcota bacterium]MBU1508717.1 IPT/TIG domain-containing protein [Myxococcota bacterium]